MKTLKKLSKNIQEKCKENSIITVTLVKETARPDQNGDYEYRTKYKTVEIETGNDFTFAESARDYSERLGNKVLESSAIIFIATFMALAILGYISVEKGYISPENNYPFITKTIFVASIIVTATTAIIKFIYGKAVFKKYNPQKPKTPDELKSLIISHPEMKKLLQGNWEYVRYTTCQFKN